VKIHRYHEKVYFEIVQGCNFLRKKKHSQVKKQLNELVNLRNNVFHFRPINIYLVYGKRNREDFLIGARKATINKVLDLRYNREIKNCLDEIFKNAENFVEIKKQPLSS